MPRGRPKKFEQLEQMSAQEAYDLQCIPSPQYFNADMADFFNAGQPYRLQRYFIACGDAEKAERIRTLMLAWFDAKLGSMIPSEWKG